MKKSQVNTESTDETICREVEKRGKSGGERRWEKQGEGKGVEGGRGGEGIGGAGTGGNERALTSDPSHSHCTLNLTTSHHPLTFYSGKEKEGDGGGREQN